MSIMHLWAYCTRATCDSFSVFDRVARPLLIRVLAPVYYPHHRHLIADRPCVPYYLYMSAHKHAYAGTHAPTHIYAHTRTSMFPHVHTHIHICLRQRTHARTNTHTHTHTCTHLCTRATSICLRQRKHEHANTHTHTHTHTYIYAHAQLIYVLANRLTAARTSILNAGLAILRIYVCT